MFQHIAKALAMIVAALLIGSLHLRGQEPDIGSSSSDLTEEQLDAINRVGELMGRLQALRWGPDVVWAVSALGSTACRYNQELGVRVFETAYSMVPESDLDLNDDWALRTLSRLAAAASRCDPRFRDRALTRKERGPELLAREHLDAVLKNMSTNPSDAAKFGKGVASHVHALDVYGQLAFVEGLWKIRKQLPIQADDLFRNALSVAATAGTTADLYTLGNYVFGPSSETEGTVGQMPLPNGGQAYLLSEVRPGFSDELAGQYAEIATDALLKRGTLTSQDAGEFSLATQLASWAEVEAPGLASALNGLLGSQSDAIATSSHLSGLQERLESSHEGDPSASLEGMIESEADEETKDLLRLSLFGNRIRGGELSGAETLLDDMRPEIRRPLSDIVELKRAGEAITNDDLEDAATRVAGLKDSLHQVLGALSLASGYWERSRDAEDGSAEDRDSAARALLLAIGAIDSVPGYLRPLARISVAAVLAKYGQHEDALNGLELGLQGLNTHRSGEDTEASALLTTGSVDGGFVAEARHSGENLFIDDLDLPHLSAASFEWAVFNLSSSPDVELNRLDSIVSKAVNPQLRAEGLIAVAMGALARTFERGPGLSSTDEPAKSAGSSDEATDPGRE